MSVMNNKVLINIKTLKVFLMIHKTLLRHNLHLVLIKINKLNRKVLLEDKNK